MTDAAAAVVRASLVFAGAGLGGVARYGLGTLVQRGSADSFPLGTLIVNVTGCLLAGFLGTLVAGLAAHREEARVALLVGLLGGYTTFSAFGRETVDLIAQGRWSAAAANVLLSNALGLAGVWLGARAAARLTVPGTP